MATGGASKGGYDYAFVTAPPKALECPVCLLTLRDPHVISCCGNEFCQPCIERVQRDGKPCPLCNAPEFTTLLHKKLVREVNALVVYCPQREAGCEWEGELGYLQVHLTGRGVSEGCGYVIVPCSYKCGAELPRHMISDHELETCPKRPIEKQVASLERKLASVVTENQLLKQELNEIKKSHRKQMEGHKQEMILCYQRELEKVKEVHKLEIQSCQLTLKTLQVAYKKELGELNKVLGDVKRTNEQLMQDINKRCSELQKDFHTLKKDFEVHEAKIEGKLESVMKSNAGTTPTSITSSIVNATQASAIPARMPGLFLPPESAQTSYHNLPFYSGKVSKVTQPRTLCATAGCIFKGYKELNNFCPDCYRDEYNVVAPPEFPLV